MNNKELHNDVYNQSREHFITSINHFRDIMCSNKYTLDHKDQAFDSLCQDYLRCKLDPRDIMHMESMTDEWTRRRYYELCASLERETNMADPDDMCPRCCEFRTACDCGYFDDC